MRTREPDEIKVGFRNEAGKRLATVPIPTERRPDVERLRVLSGHVFAKVNGCENHGAEVFMLFA